MRAYGAIALVVKKVFDNSRPTASPSCGPGSTSRWRRAAKAGTVLVIVDQPGEGLPAVPTGRDR
ncbi:hypothetical protein ACWDAG_17165 [Streptomyces sp. NPDC001157]